MAIEVSAELRAAIDAVERTPLVRVRLDWDGDGYGTTATLDDGRVLDVDDLTRHTGAVTIDRALATDLPDQVRIVTGYAAAAATVELNVGDPADESVDAADWFTRGSTRSPVGARERIRRPVTVDIGMATVTGPQYVRRLTGLSRRLQTDVDQDRTAQLEVLDHRELLRDTVLLIPGSGPRSGYDGTFVVTQALHACGFYAGPAPRAEAVLWQPCYGSLLPVLPRPTDSNDWAFLVGPTGPSRTRPTFRTGRFVLAANGGYFTSDTNFERPYVKIPPAAAWDGHRGRVELWVYGATSPTSGVTGSTGRHIILAGGPGSEGTYAVVQHNGALALLNKDAGGTTLHSYVSGLVVPSDGGWHAVGISWDHTLQRGVFYLDGRTETVTTAISLSEFTTAVTSIVSTHYAAFSDLQVSTVAHTTGWLADQLAPTAVIDPSRLQLQACIESRAREAWELLTELAAAEQAVVTCDELGVPQYRTRRRLVDTAGQTVQRTVRIDADLLAVETDDGIDQVRNIILVSFTPVQVSDLVEMVYTDTTPRVVPRLGYADFVVSPNDRIIDLQTFLLPIDIIQFDAGGMVDPYIAITFNSDLTQDFFGAVGSNGVSASVISWTPQAATIRVVNQTSQPVYVAGLGLRGTRAVVGNQITVEASSTSSIARYGPQPLDLSMTQWVQSAAVARGLARAVLLDLKTAQLTITKLRVVGDPTRQLSDREALVYPDRAELEGEYWLTAVKDDVDDAGAYIQEVSLRRATTVLRWGIGRWGRNTWG